MKLHKKTKFIAIGTLSGLLMLGIFQNATNAPDPGCKLPYYMVPNTYAVYDLVPGAKGYSSISETAPDGGYVVLKNNSGKHLQVNKVSMIPFDKNTKRPINVKNQWGEFCVYNNSFKRYVDPAYPNEKDQLHPGQGTAGDGEVGCVAKPHSDSMYNDITWSGGSNNTALSVPPNSCIVINGYTLFNDKHYTTNWYNVNVSPQTRGVKSYRQPQYDHVFYGNNKMQVTAWSPWKNTTGRNLHFIGSSNYAAPGKMHVACIYILNSAGKVRKKYCSPQYPVNVSGTMSVPTEVILPNESIAGQASNVGAEGAAWGWATFLHIW